VREVVASTGRTVQADTLGLYGGGPVRGVRTYTFLIGKGLVRGEYGEERSGFFD
jgi:hypothetical protein